jgi:hypothetical protein
MRLRLRALKTKSEAETAQLAALQREHKAQPSAATALALQRAQMFPRNAAEFKLGCRALLYHVMGSLEVMYRFQARTKNLANSRKAGVLPDAVWAQYQDGVNTCNAVVGDVQLLAAELKTGWDATILDNAQACLASQYKKMDKERLAKESKAQQAELKLAADKQLAEELRQRKQSEVQAAQAAKRAKVKKARDAERAYAELMAQEDKQAALKKRQQQQQKKNKKKQK